MNIAIWVLQVVLAAAFLAHGWLLLSPPANLIDAMNATMSTGFRVFLGAAEVAAAVGLTLPGITRILPWLISWAAAGVAVVMVSATIFHLQRGEISSAMITMVLLIVAVLVGYFRWKVKPIRPRIAA
jgi:uncharacterized membrane protein YphA (DoxX/SURF4 family)